MERTAIRELSLSNTNDQVGFTFLYDRPFFKIRRVEILSHMEVPENLWRRAVEKLTLKFSLSGTDAATLTVPIPLKSLVPSNCVRPEFDVDLDVPLNLTKLSDYTSNQWQNATLKIEMKEPMTVDLRVHYESDMLQV